MKNPMHWPSNIGNHHMEPVTDRVSWDLVGNCRFIAMPGERFGLAYDIHAHIARHEVDAACRAIDVFWLGLIW